MPNIGDTWHPSKGPGLTSDEEKELHDLEKKEEREKNRIKNENRKKAKVFVRTIPRKRIKAGKELRHAFGGAFGRAPSNVRFMAAQGTTMDTSNIPRGDKVEEVEPQPVFMQEYEGDDE